MYPVMKGINTVSIQISHNLAGFFPTKKDSKNGALFKLLAILKAIELCRECDLA